MKIRRLKNYPGYAVSKSGIVFSNRMRGPRTGKIGPWKELAQFVSVWGYLIVGVTNLAGKHVSVRVHCLVAEAWIGLRPNGYEVNHKDGVKTHNHVSNLEYLTKSENMRHAVAHGLHVPVRGERQGGAKLTMKDVLLMRSLYAEGKITQSGLSVQFNISSAHVCDIIHRNAWRHI